MFLDDSGFPSLPFPVSRLGIQLTACLGIVLTALPFSFAAERVVELPVLGAIHTSDQGVFEVLLMTWDGKSEPTPPQLQCVMGGVRFGETQLGAMAQAFAHAIQRTPGLSHGGTVTVRGAAYRPVGNDGPSGGAAMAVGFIALFKGDRVQRGIAITGTLESDGRIGAVGGIPDKIRAAKREGYHTVLIPGGQIHDAGWNLNELALRLNIAVKEVGTVDEAYHLMTGNHL
ncbi:MAG: Exported protein [Nitrospira sp.]